MSAVTSINLQGCELDESGFGNMLGQMPYLAHFVYKYNLWGSDYYKEAHEVSGMFLGFLSAVFVLLSRDKTLSQESVTLETCFPAPTHLESGN